MFYIAAFIIILLFSFNYSKKNLILVTSMLFVISAFRYEVGCDWTGYINQYMLYSNMSIDEILNEREILWVSLINIINFHKMDYEYLNVLSSLIFFVGMYFFSLKQKNPLLFVAILYPVTILNLPMSGIRQATALGIVFFSMISFLNKKIILYLLLVSIATLVHSSAAIMFVFAPFVKLDLNFKNVTFSFVFFILPILVYLSYSESVSVAKERYFMGQIDAVGGYFRIAVVFIAYLIFYKTRDLWKTQSYINFKFICLSAILLFGTIFIVPFSSVTADRLNYYLTPFQAVIISNVLSFKRDIRLKNAVSNYIVILMILLIGWAVLSELFQKCYLPYSNWLLEDVSRLKY